MKALTQIHSAAAQRSEVSLKLKPFKKLSRKLSSTSWKALLSIAVILSTVGFATAARAYLYLGDRGDNVYFLQLALGIPADGVFGEQTRQAVLNYQRRCGLLVDGIAGPETLSSLASNNCNAGLVPIQPDPGPGGIGGVGVGPFVVVIPGNDSNLLADVRVQVPGAFVDSARRGDFINAGRFPTRSQAANRAENLRNSGFNNARVDYRP